LAATYRRDRDDLMQAAAVKAFIVARKRGKVDVSKNPFSYLSRVVINELNAGLRREGKHAHGRLDQLE
jgi:DNA-directed RNA polymerase specialized sigma24 family protein